MATEVEVQFWVNDREGIVSYTVAVEGGLTNPDEAVAAARQKAIDDGYDDVNLKDVLEIED